MYLSLYFAETDIEVSPPNVFTNAIEFTLRADLSEADEVKLYAKTDDGYRVLDAQVTAEGETADRWAFAPDDNGAPGEYQAWGAPFNIGTLGGSSTGTSTTNKFYFWLKARAIPGEPVRQDATVLIHLDGIVEAV
jgi:hypothetical protein